MSRIESIEITHHQIVLDPPFPASWDPTPRTRFPATIVRVRDTDGREGVGSGDAMYGFADYQRWFIGEPVLALAQHDRRLANIGFHAGRPWPLSVALHDLAGHIAGQPVWRMLGGSNPSVRLYASTAVHRSTAATVSMVQQLVSQGFQAVKLRFGRPSIDDDLEVVRAVRSATDIAVMVDCNQGWRMPWDTAEPWDLDQAWQVAQALAECGVFWMEEPLFRGDYAGMAALRERLAGSGLLVAGGEMTREPYEFEQMLRMGCLDVYQPDVVCTGGCSGLAALGRRVLDEGHLFTPHTWGNGVGVLANLHLAAAVAGEDGAQWVEWPYDPPEWSLERRDFPLRVPLDQALHLRHGVVTLGEQPGLGLALNETALAASVSSVATFSSEEPTRSEQEGNH